MVSLLAIMKSMQKNTFTNFLSFFLSPKMTNGFFIECGAYDGEGYSNSLLFELERNWTGLLIEPNYKAFKSLKEKQRKVEIKAY